MARRLIVHQSRRARAGERDDVRAEVLLDEDHPGRARLRGDAVDEWYIWDSREGGFVLVES